VPPRWRKRRRRSSIVAWASVRECHLRTLHPRRSFAIVEALRCVPLAVVFVRVKNVGRGRHQPGATRHRSGSLRDSDRIAIGRQPLRLGLDCAVGISSPTEPTPERADYVHGSHSRPAAACRRSSAPAPACASVELSVEPPEVQKFYRKSLFSAARNVGYCRALFRSFPSPAII